MQQRDAAAPRVSEVPRQGARHTLSGRGNAGSVSVDHVNPAHSMGLGGPYVNASDPLSS